MRPTILICIALVTVTFAVYWQVGNHEFLSFDDDIYIARNVHIYERLTTTDIVWAFTSVEKCNWHPITWLSHMLDGQLFGMNPRGHHLTNVSIHCLATLLLFFLLIRLTDGLWQSAFVAAMFALHPLHVESVAWAAERKDVLSAFFWFATLLLYVRYVAARQSGLKGISLYLLTLLTFMLGLMSKPILVTLPVVMLLMDYWPLLRFGNKVSLYSLFKEKLPFFACSILSSAITIYAQRKGGAVVPLEWIPFTIRIQNALVSYLKYIIKTLWPLDLAVLYPLILSIPLWQVISSAAALLIISAAAIAARRRYPFLTVGWFWFLVTLLPVIGLVQVGNQSMADRYMYLPIVGLFIMIAWGVPALLGPEQGWQRSVRRVLAPVAALAVITTVTITWRQIGYWQNNITLYRHALQVTTDNYIIHYNLGIAYGRTGEVEASINEFKKAVILKPSDIKIRNLLASTLAENGYIDAALSEFSISLAINPNDREAISSQKYWQDQKKKQLERSNKTAN